MGLSGLIGSDVYGQAQDGDAALSADRYGSGCPSRAMDDTGGVRGDGSRHAARNLGAKSRAKADMISALSCS